MEENKVLEERKEKIFAFLKKDKYFSAFAIISAFALLSIMLSKANFFIFAIFSPFIWFLLFIFSAISAILVYFKLHKFMFYPLAAWVTWLAVYIRTLNLPLLRDVTTGGWTLGPDLDPFLFLRWAKYIVAHGTIMAHDILRYVPLGYSSKEELVFLSYLIAWFHKAAAVFGSTSVEQSAALFPAFMFAITVIAFFFFVRKVFINSLGETKADIVALLASLFLSIIPGFLPRTIAGIPEKESAAFFFLFMAFFLFLSAWQSKKTYSSIIFAVLAGISTGLMALVWGGYFYIFLTLGLIVFSAFIFGQVDFKKFILYSVWLVSSLLSYLPFTAKYTLYGVSVSPTTGIAFGVFLVIAVHFLIYGTAIKNYFNNQRFSKLPKPIISLIVAIVFAIAILTLIFGIDFVPGKLGDVYRHLITPITDRLGVTVAENRQPFFGEWADTFGPKIRNIPLTFWLFFAGSVYLFYKMMNVFSKKERITMTLGYLAFLTCIIFSRYSGSSVLNGTNAISLMVYILGIVSLLGTFGYYYYKQHKLSEENKFKKIEFGILLVFAFFVLCIISARGAIRLVMMLIPPVAIIISYLAVVSLSDAFKSKEGSFKLIKWILVILIILSTFTAAKQFYLEAAATGRGYAPSSYNQQWQKAMAWVRDSTPQDAVFGHWWDYGYWVQTLGERATVLDGGNAIPYWDHLMGRYGLTSPNIKETLEFLYTHDTTHFLIDSSDIGKYPAFSSIGSNENYDRYSWMNVFIKDPRQVQETKNSTILVYTGGTATDADIIYEENGTKIFLPENRAVLAGIIVEKDGSRKVAKSPIGVFIYQNKQFRIPLRYAFEDNLIDFKSGLNAGIFIFPEIETTASGNALDADGALIYLSNKTIDGLLTRFYLFNEESKYFKLVHSEDDFVVEQLKSTNVTNKDIILYQGVRGPIRIWEINYPIDIKENPAYLERGYPNINLTKVAR